MSLLAVGRPTGPRRSRCSSSSRWPPTSSPGAARAGRAATTSARRWCSSTCNRVEVYAEVDDVPRRRRRRQPGPRPPGRRAPSTALADHLYVHYEDAGRRRTCSPVAAGLDSMVVGETQILGQLRAAYALARDEGTVGRPLHALVQQALRVGKRVHAETGIDQAGASLVSVALDRPRSRDRRPAGPPRAGRRRRLDGRAGRRPRCARRGAERRRQQPHRGADRPPGWPSRRRPRRRRWPTWPPSWPPPTCVVTCTGATGTGARPATSSPRAARPGRPARWSCSTSRCPRDVDAGRRRAARRARRRPRAAAGRARSPTAGRRRRRRRRRAAIVAGRGRGRPAAGRAQAAEVAPTVSALRSQAAEVVDAELLRLAAPAARPRRPRSAPRSPAPCAGSSTSCCTQPTVRVKELAADARRRPTTPAPLRELFGLGIDAADRRRHARRRRHADPARSGRRRDRSTPRPRRCAWAPGAARWPAPSRRPVADALTAATGRAGRAGATSSPRATARSAPIAQLGGTGVFVAALRDALLAGDDRPRRALLQGPAHRAGGRAGHRRGAAARGPARRARRPRRAHARRAAARRHGRHRRAAPRRPAARARPRLDVVPIRGNVDTRLGRVPAGRRARRRRARPRRAGPARPARRDHRDARPAAGAARAGAGRARRRVPRRRRRTRSSCSAGSTTPTTRAASSPSAALLAALEAGCSAPVAAYAEVAEGDDRPRAVPARRR